MDKIAQYENNMIYIIKKQEGFFSKQGQLQPRFLLYL